MITKTKNPESKKVIDSLIYECTGMVPWTTLSSLNLVEQTKEALRAEARREYQSRQHPCKDGFNERYVLKELQKQRDEAIGSELAEYSAFEQRIEIKAQPHHGKVPI